MAVELELESGSRAIGKLASEPDVGDVCEAGFGGRVCGKSESPHYCEPRVAQIEAGLGKLRHLKSPDGFKLLGWQKRHIVEPLFGVVVWSENFGCWVRRFTSVWITIPRKQGKTYLVAAITAVFLRILPAGSSLLVGAQSVDEAKKTFGKHLNAFINETPAWRAAIKYRKSELAWEDVRTGNECRVKTIQNPESARGPDWVFSALDEIAWVRDPEEAVEVISSSWDTSSPSEPIMFQFSTLPGDPASWGRMHNDWMAEVAREPDLAPDTLPFIRTLGENQDWRDEQVWREVVPGLDEGITSLDNYRLRAKRAEKKVSARNKFLTEMLNAPQISQASYIEGELWMDQNLKPSRDEVYDKIAGFSSGVYAGYDFSRVSDLSSFALVAHDGTGLWIWQQSFVPERVAFKLDKMLGGRVSEWLEKGLLRILPEGSESNYIAELTWETIKDLRGLEVIGFDYNDAAQATKFWDGKPVRHERCPQGFVLSPAIKSVEDLAMARKIIHGQDDLLFYSVTCAEIEISVKEKLAIRKPHRKSMAARVDPLVAALTAHHTRLNNEDPQSGFYLESRYQSKAVRARRASQG